VGLSPINRDVHSIAACDRERYTCCVELELASPSIESRCDPPLAASIWVRLLSLAIASGCVIILIVAARLTPNHLGYGSHWQLRMPECQFMQRTGIPCPSCGMTTSFTWFVRGNLAASLYVQPMGTVLAALCCCGFWAGSYIAITGRPIYRMLALAPGNYVFMPLLAFAVAAWAWKIFIHLSGHDGW
jgi:hypothetical protein